MTARQTAIFQRLNLIKLNLIKLSDSLADSLKNNGKTVYETQRHLQLVWQSSQR